MERQEQLEAKLSRMEKVLTYDKEVEEADSKELRRLVDEVSKPAEELGGQIQT